MLVNAQVAKDAQNLSRCFPASMVGWSRDLLVSEARTQRSYERLAAYGLRPLPPQ